jgi:hypothetical protein
MTRMNERPCHDMWVTCLGLQGMSVLESQRLEGVRGVEINDENGI